MPLVVYTGAEACVMFGGVYRLHAFVEGRSKTEGRDSRLAGTASQNQKVQHFDRLRQELVGKAVNQATSAWVTSVMFTWAVIIHSFMDHAKMVASQAWLAM